ncbi:MAG: symmetrical bis(5'-nucleosyl)-tetraphosphatase [Gammaproteobacteria bacterium]|nr:symmetrical bis(5'-nucleosyl)-tetraphosphatase [Gammaproteobacteria bacterium]
MTIYAVGDLQGCYDPLLRLLEQVRFDPSRDTLWCVGDLVNRGPQSLKVLRFLKSIENQCVTVLGNHDIHLLAMAYGLRGPRPSDTLKKVLKAPDLQELMDWLRHQPLMVQDQKRRTVMCHAGIYPWWTRKQALKRAAEVEALFRDEASCEKLLQKIYSNQPSKWKSSLGKTQRARFIINAFTRMRFCSPKGHLNLTESGYAGRTRKNRLPWFELSHPDLDDWRIVFGHWSALGLLNTPQHLCLDTGYIWGGDMTMARLSKNPEKKVKIFSTPFG